MRVVVSKIQEHLTHGIVTDVVHVSSQNQLGDIFMKNRACSGRLLEILETGQIHKEENEKG